MKIYQFKNLQVRQDHNYTKFLDCFNDVILTKLTSTLNADKIDILSIAQVVSTLETLSIEYNDNPSKEVFNDNVQYEIENSLSPNQYRHCRNIITDIRRKYRLNNKIYSNFCFAINDYIKKTKSKTKTNQTESDI